MMHSYQFAEYYDQYGGDYFRKRTEQGGMLFNEFIEIPIVTKLIAEVKGSKTRALDIGSSFGYYSRLLANFGYDVTALDVSAGMIEIAKRYCEAFAQIRFVNSGFLEYDFGNTNFDLILACFMLGYFEDLHIFFKKIKTLAGRESTVITSMLHPIVQAKVTKSQNGYVLKNYFNDKTHFESDFLSTVKKISLFRWHYADVISACVENGLYIEKLIEPKLESDSYIKGEQFEFYSQMPSVSIFVIKAL